MRILRLCSVPQCEVLQPWPSAGLYILVSLTCFPQSFRKCSTHLFYKQRVRWSATTRRISLKERDYTAVRRCMHDTYSLQSRPQTVFLFIMRQTATICFQKDMLKACLQMNFRGATQGGNPAPCSTFIDFSIQLKVSRWRQRKIWTLQDLSHIQKALIKPKTDPEGTSQSAAKRNGGNDTCQRVMWHLWCLHSAP